MPSDITLDDAGQVVEDTPATAEDERALGWTCVVIAAITVLLALFSAASMKSWSETLAPTPVNGVIRQWAEGWYDTTEHLGLAAPRAGLRAGWTTLRDMRFPEPPDTGPDPALHR